MPHPASGPRCFGRSPPWPRGEQILIYLTDSGQLRIDRHTQRGGGGQMPGAPPFNFCPELCCVSGCGVWYFVGCSGECVYVCGRLYRVYVRACGGHSSRLVWGELLGSVASPVRSEVVTCALLTMFPPRWCGASHARSYVFTTGSRTWSGTGSSCKCDTYPLVSHAIPLARTLLLGLYCSDSTESS